MDTTSTLTPTEVIARVRAARQTEHDAALAQLDLALAWAHLHPCPAQETPAHWGQVDLHGEAVTPLAGPGAPLVAEFAPAELGAALGITLDAARQLVGDALELAHRLPRLWDLTHQGAVAPWRARLIARETTDLTREAALFADRLIAATPHRLGQVNAARLVHEARLFFDPDRAVDDEQKALARRGVWLHRGTTPATTDITMTLDTPDAELLDATIGRIAHDLKTLGATDTLDTRRAHAAGILADPQHALDLMSGREGAAPTKSGGATHLYVHLTPADLADTGAACIERLGAASTDLLTEWLTRYADRGASINIRPVLDVTADPATDRHDPTQAIRETVTLRDAHCVFPGCRTDSRSCDLDHITEYQPLHDGGPPGQTRPTNLAPLCRTHHRIKTHTAWAYKRLDHGYTWTSPTGHQYDVLPSSRLPARRL